MTMHAAADSSYRRMGAILVERGSITPRQLADALLRQEDTGRLLGEICVEQWGLDRLALADALSEQWDAMRRDAQPAHRRRADETSFERQTDERVASDELRVLLHEAEAARTELALKTDELGRRLAVLETLVIGVSGALEDLRLEGH